MLKFPKRLKELRKELTKGTLWAVPEGYDLDRYVGEMCAGIKAEALRGVFRDGLLGGGSPLTYSEACYIRNDWGKTPVVSAITMLPVFQTSLPPCTRISSTLPTTFTPPSSA